MQRLRRGLRDHDHLAVMVGALLEIYVPEQKEEREHREIKIQSSGGASLAGISLSAQAGPTILVDAIDPANLRPNRDVVRGCQ